MPKKKSQLKNPQRGFATTSVVKKKEPEPEIEASDDQENVPKASLQSKEGGLNIANTNTNSNGTASASIRTATNSGTNGSGSLGQTQTSWDDTEEKKEAEERAAYAERVKSASEKEAARVVKTLEYERRMSSSYAEFRWDDPLHLRDQAIQLALEEQERAPLLPIKEEEEKVVIRVATISLVLQKLAFTEEQIAKCLTSVPDLSIESAIDWMYLRFEPSTTETVSPQTGYKPYGLGVWKESELKAAPTKQAKSTPRAKQDRSIAGFSTPSSSTTSDASVIFSNKPALLEEDAKKAPQKSSLLDYRDPNESSSDEEEEDDRGTDSSRKQAGILNGPLSNPSIAKLNDEDEDEMDPVGNYVAAKLKLTSLQRKFGLAGKAGKKGSKAKASPRGPDQQATAIDLQDLENLESRLKDYQRDYLFNQKEADAIYLAERVKLDKIELAERLALKAKERSSTASSPITSAVNSRPPSPTGATSSTQNETLKESADDSLFGALLEEPEQTNDSSTEASLTNEKGDVIQIRDMPLPKAFTGKTPRSLLDDALRRLDKGAKATFKLLGSTRAVRAVVSIRWDGGRLEQFGMEDEACSNQDQAFHYVATLALFAVSEDGSLHRLLPGPYRDLWDELEGRKRIAVAQQYEQELARYKGLASVRLAVPSQAEEIPKVSDVRQTPVVVQGSSSITLGETESEALRSAYELQRGSASYQKMLPIRQSLPIFSYRDHILSTIEHNQVVVLCGETGCGKSTQTPTMILEQLLSQGKHVKIYCTEPRRISAISLAQRVSQELGESPGVVGTSKSLIGYNIRLESRVSQNSRLIYATTGILLRMLESDTELLDVTHIIIDEVHERSIDSDFLLIILKGLLKRRKDLRVMLMSATVDAEKIASYMGHTTPVVQVPGRTFPVKAYFLEDAVELSQYHLEPDSDSSYLQRIQKRNLASFDEAPADDDGDEEEHSVFRQGYSRRTQSTLQLLNEHIINFDLLLSLLETVCFGNPELQPFSQAILVFLPSLDTIRKMCDLLDAHHIFGSRDFQVFPLHSSISNDQQSRVFEVGVSLDLLVDVPTDRRLQVPPRGVRKIVVSTNIAETGVTIPDITAVIDSGKHKEMRFDEKRQISKLVECWIARSNAMQRRGRAGRVQEGICFHMFTNSRFDTALAEHPIPEMLRLSLQDLALRIKVLKFSGSIETVLLQALDPPLTANIQRAVSSLIDIKALTTTEDITQLGRHLVKLPLDVYTAKLCLLAPLFGCLDAALTIAAILNSKTFFVTPFGREMEADTIKRSFRRPDEHSDFLVAYRVYCLWRSNCEAGSWSAFTRKHFLSHITLTQIEELKGQYMSNLIEAGFISSENFVVRPAKGPRIRFVQLEAHLTSHSEDSGIVMGCIAAAMHPKLLYKEAGNIWKTLSNNAPIAIHPSSSNFVHGRRPDLGKAEFVTYFNIQQSKKLYVWENGAVSDTAVMLLCGEVDVKHHAHSAALDRKIRRHVERKSGLAIEQIRQHFDRVWLAKLDAPSRPLDLKDQAWFTILAKAISSSSAEEAREQKRIERPTVAINVVRHT